MRIHRTEARVRAWSYGDDRTDSEPGPHKIMELPVAISTTAAIPLPIAPRYPVWPLLVIAVGLTASVAWTGLLMYLVIALVTHAFF
jgi:hypothetical protein